MERGRGWVIGQVQAMVFWGFVTDVGGEGGCVWGNANYFFSPQPPSLLPSLCIAKSG
jgi:hypothetical protein